MGDRFPEHGYFTSVVVMGSGAPCFRRHGNLTGFQLNHREPSHALAEPDPVPAETKVEPAVESSDSAADLPGPSRPV